MAKLPVDIDQLFIDIFYYFYLGSKRNQEFADRWCSLFTSSEPKAILKHCPTCWLSLLCCVGRYLHQYEGLKSYFLLCSEQSAKVISITTILDPKPFCCTKLLCSNSDKNVKQVSFW